MFIDLMRSKPTKEKIANKSTLLRLGLLLGFLTSCTDSAVSLNTEQATLRAGQGTISSAFSRDGQFEFVGSFHHGGDLWRRSDNEHLYSWNHKKDQYSAIRSAVFSEDDKFVATTTGDSVVIWEIATGQSMRFFQSVIDRQPPGSIGPNISTPERILAIDMAKNYILLGQENNQAVVFDSLRGGIIGTLPHDGPVSSVSLDDSANFAATGSHDGYVRYWSLDAGEQLFSWQHNQPIDLVLLSPSGKLIVGAAYKGAVSLWYTSDGREAMQFYKVNQGITALALNQAETKLLIGTSREKIILWDLENQRIAKTWTVPNDGPWHKAAILSVAFGMEQRYLAAASNGYTYAFD